MTRISSGLGWAGLLFALPVALALACPVLAQVYEMDLGPNTDAIARAMTRFDPDSSWQKVTP